MAKSRLEKAREALTKASAEVQAAEKEYFKNEGIKAKFPAAYGISLTPDHLGDGVVIADRDDVLRDVFDAEYSARTIYHGPNLTVRGTKAKRSSWKRGWWIFYDGDFVALYSEDKILSDFVGSGQTDDIRIPPKKLPPLCKCGAYHYPGANDGLCAY